MNNLNIDFSGYTVVNYLWPEFVNNFGFDKAKQATRQALDLQCMNGNTSTIPILLAETGGIALVNCDIIYLQTGILCNGKNVILILSIKSSLIQIIGN